MLGRVKDIVIVSAVAAIYVVLSLCLSGISFGILQLRIACMLHLFCRYDRRYIYACVLGNVITNIFSPLGFIDVIFGMIAATFACVMFYVIKNKWIANIISACIVGVTVGTELYMVYGGEIMLPICSITISQFIVYAVGSVIVPKIYEIIERMGEQK